MITTFNKIILSSVIALAGSQARAQTAQCGDATRNTRICIYPDAGRMGVISAGGSVFFDAAPQPSSTLAGGTTYLGVAPIGFIAGMSDATTLALVTDAPSRFGLLYYLAVDGWRLWPGSGWMTLAVPAVVGPIAAGVSN